VKKLITFISVCVSAGLVFWWVYAKAYAGPRDALLKELASLEASNASGEKALKETPRVRAELKKRSEGAMSGSSDQVDHELRVAIRALAERAGLSDIVVTTVEPQWPANPYTRARRVRSPSIRTALRDQRDFGILKAELRAQGTVEEVFRTIALVQGQSWVQRVRSVSIEPRSEDRSRLELRLGVSALYIPDFGKPALPGVEPTDQLLADIWQPIAAKNVFKYDPPVPPPVEDGWQPVETVQAPIVPDVPAPPPYHHWRVTSIIVREGVVGPGAIEVGMTNIAGEAPVTLTPGASVLDATLVGAASDAATFEIAGETFAVALGQDLSQRHPAEPIH
jgi:hypothetical protein